MSLFRPRGPGERTPAERGTTKLTVRLPRALPEARVVAVHGSYGDEVKRGDAVMTLRVGEDRHVLNAPRDGRLLPMAGPGDELRAGDALFALHFESEPRAAGEGAPPPRRAAGAERAPRATPPGARGQHVPVLGEPAEPPARRRARRQAQPELDPDGLRDRVATPPRRPVLTLKRSDEGPSLAGSLVRILLALALLAAGTLLLLPLLGELAFGSSESARLVVTLAALALGFLTWRLLARRAGRLAVFGVALAGAAWTVLVILTMTGSNPLPLGPVPLPDTHALAPASRTRVPPARPATSPPLGFSGIRSEAAAGAPPPALAAPESRTRFSALPTGTFALTAPPPAPPPVRAGRPNPAPEPPATAAAPSAAAPAEAPTGTAEPPLAAPAAAPAGPDEAARTRYAIAPPAPREARALPALASVAEAAAEARTFWPQTETAGVLPALWLVLGPGETAAPPASAAVPEEPARPRQAGAPPLAERAPMDSAPESVARGSTAPSPAAAPGAPGVIGPPGLALAAPPRLPEPVGTP